MAAWSPGWGDVIISVNAAPAPLRDPAFGSRQLETLGRHGVGPRRFVVETPTHLRRLPIDKRKIDKGFVTDLGAGIESATIIHVVASTGRMFGFQVIVEGVETAEQHAFLRAAGAHAMRLVCGRAANVA